MLPEKYPENFLYTQTYTLKTQLFRKAFIIHSMLELYTVHFFDNSSINN